jgi:hypothetical protein
VITINLGRADPGEPPDVTRLTPRATTTGRTRRPVERPQTGQPGVGVRTSPPRPGVNMLPPRRASEWGQVSRSVLDIDEGQVEGVRPG